MSVHKGAAARVVAMNEIITPQSMKKLLYGVDMRSLVAEHGSPLMVLDLERVREQYRAVQTTMPGVKPYYALKALSHPAVIAAIRDEDGYFDAASPQEVQWLVEAGIDMRRCIYTNPIKKPGDVAAAVAAGVTQFVYDNESDLANYAGYEDKVQLLLRLSFRNPDALGDLSYKFGVEPDAAMELLDAARKRDLRVAGLSFHAGTQMGSVEPPARNIARVHELMKVAQAQGHALRVLDIGGGFPVAYDASMPTLAAFAESINAALEPVRADGIEIWSEPGRFVAAPSIVFVGSVVSMSQRGGLPWYYLDDGLYGSYSNIMSDHVMPVFFAEKALDELGMELHKSVLAGPTCDSTDVMTTAAMMPELEVGDLIVSPMMGAYTTETASTFNGIPKAQVVVL